MRCSLSILLFLGLILAGGSLAGCDSIENPRVMVPGEPAVAETRSVELQRSQFDDVPVPDGFEFVTRGNRSFSYDRGGVRVGRFVYWGKTEAAEVAAFFRRTMGLEAYGWSLRAEKTHDGGTEFDFHKHQTGCRVKIFRQGGGTYVHIDLSGPA